MTDSQEKSRFDPIRALELLWIIGGVSTARFVEKYWGWTWYEAVFGTLVLGVVTAFLIGLFIYVWQSVFRPTGSLLRDEGIVGLGRFLYEKFFYVLLYGRKGKQS